MTTTRRISASQSFAAGGAVLAVRVAGIVFSVAIAAVAVRELGDVRFGAWATITGILGVATVADFGAGWYLARAVAQDPDPETARDRLATVTAFLVGTGLTTTALAAVAARPLADGLDLAGADKQAFVGALVAAVAATALLSLASAAVTMLFGVGRGVVAAGVVGLGALVQCSTSVVLLRDGAGLAGLVAGIAANAVVTSFVGGLVLRRTLGGRLVGRPSLEHLRSAWSFGSWVQLTSAVDALGALVDRVALGSARGAASVVPLDIGARVGSAIKIGTSSAMAGGFGAIAERVRRMDSPEAAAVHSWMHRLVVVVAASGTCLMIAAAEPIYVLLTGVNHVNAELLVGAVCLAVTFTAVTGPITSILRACGRSRTEAGCSLMGWTVRVGLAVTLAPIWGLAGVLLAGALGALTVAVMLATRVRVYRISLWPGPRVAGFALTSIVAALLIGVLTAVPPRAGTASSLALIAFDATIAAGSLWLAGRAWRPLAPVDAQRLSGALPVSASDRVARILGRFAR